MAKTIRRDALMRKAQKGLLVGRVVFSFGRDDYRYDVNPDKDRKFSPVKVMTWEEKRNTYDTKFLKLTEDDFKSSVGYARDNEDGTFTLGVHSNLVYEFKSRRSKK